jgi:CheY-like chemotaxis protein
MTDSPVPRILCVDDEPAVLEGLERVLFESFDVQTETVPAHALARLASPLVFDVIVSDMRMPAMDGATLLAAASRVAPDTMRILLTGYADVDAAVAAVNDGRIFRFLRKPCDADELARVIDEAVRARRQTLAERELLENTLSGAVRTLGDMLALLAPEIFRHSAALARAAAHVANKLHLEPRWAIEVAARLCLVGCVALPLDLVGRERRGEPLTPGEKASLDAHPETGFRLLSNIPRLEGVATMVRYQRQAALPKELPPSLATGARLLQVLLALDQRTRKGESFSTARQTLRRLVGSEGAAILDALADFTPQTEQAERRSVPLQQVRVGMVLAADVLATNGVVVIAKGTEVTAVVRERLGNFARGAGVREPLIVWADA